MPESARAKRYGSAESTRSPVLQADVAFLGSFPPSYLFLSAERNPSRSYTSLFLLSSVVIATRVYAADRVVVFFPLETFTRRPALPGRV